MEASRYTPHEIGNLPQLPGIYIFYNAKEEVIYIGKSKNIKKRVGEYFIPHHTHNLKTQRMITHITSIAYTVVSSEYDALLLENNLIKSFQPRYNILLKDDKTYPYLCITYDRFPRLIITRKTAPALGKYYGPFTSGYAIRATFAVIKKLFSFRTCSYNLSEVNIAKRKFKVCLDYHLGQCKGACENLQDVASYQKEIDQIEALLKNNFTAVKKTLKEKMSTAAAKLEYKQAQRFKEKLSILDQYQHKSLVTNPLMGDLDVVAIISDEKHAFIAYLHIKKGAISFTQQRVLTKKLEEPIEEVMPLVICALRSDSNSTAAEVLVNIPFEIEEAPFAISIPKIGDKRKLVELAIHNALCCKKDFLHKKHNVNYAPNLTLVKLQHDLKLKEVPNHIECFDNSNIQGHHPVAAMICFKHGKPAKKYYRHYHIKTVSGPNDFASMYEVVKRRYAHLLKEQGTLPDLIVIDGGKGQLNAAILALQALGLYGKVAIISIAKRLEALYFPNDSLPYTLSKQSPSLKLLQQIRNEAHRFAVTFHRSKRSKAVYRSTWQEIPGIGPKTWTLLLEKLGNLEAIYITSFTELQGLIGPSKAKRLHDHLRLELKTSPIEGVENK